MSTLNCIETYIDSNQNHYGCFIIEPLETGQGITLGNALRRTLLSDLTGLSITGVRINDLKHEFSIVEGLREDILEVLLNLKEVIFKSSFSTNQNKHNLNFKGYLKVKGPIVVNAGMFNLPKDSLSIINPHQYICTILDDSELYLEIDIERGKGYRLSEENRKNKIEKKLAGTKPSTLFIDSIFMPVKNVNYKIKLINDSKGNIKESLNIEILTNGSITPKRSIQESLKILMKLFYPLFMSQEFLAISSQISKKIYKENLN
tara:strand:- start:164 stop:946 length:783 start_codon:yes stop_codon:yes gene_type:complete